MIGDLRHRVSIQSIAQVPGSGATLQKSYTTDATVWARVEPLSDEARLSLVNRGSGATHRITIRHRPLTADKWLLFGTRRFKVLGFRDPGERGIELQILAEEVRES